MYKIRTIKPGFWSDGKTAKLSDTAALFFISLWNFSDDYGYFNLDSSERSHNTPRWRPQNIQALLKALEKRGLVRVSRHLGVGLVGGWHHQKIKEKRPSKWNNIEIVWDDPESDAPTLLKKDPVWDRIGKERKGPPSPSGDLPTWENQKPENKERKKLSAEAMSRCVNIWGESLKKMGVPKDPKLDEAHIAWLIQNRGEEKTELALRGYPHEEPFNGFNPRRNVNILRVKDPKLFEKFVNLGAPGCEERKTTPIVIPTSPEAGNV